MGAKTLDLEPSRHDELVAWVSHLPQFTATALSALLEEEVGDAPGAQRRGRPRAARDDAPGASPYSMWRDIAHTNTEAVERALANSSSASLPARKPAHTRPARRVRQANKFRREVMARKVPGIA